MFLRGLFAKSGVIAVVAFALQMTVNIMGISNNPETPFDEAAHFDYVVKLSQGHLPKVNEKYGQVVLSWKACESQKQEAWSYLDPCGNSSYSPKKAPFYGQSSATPYVPTYYAITAIPFELCDRISGLEPINCARLSNSLWLASAAGLGAYVLTGLGVAAALSVLISVGLNSMPAVLLQGITVNSDAVAQFGGVLMLFMLLRQVVSEKAVRQKRLILIGTCIFALTLKQTLLPLAAILMGYFESANLDKSGQRSKAFLKYALSVTTVAVSSMLLSLLQPVLRGVGGKDHMAEWLIESASDMPAKLQLAAVSALNPFTLLTWAPIALPILGTLSLFIGFTLWLLISSQNSRFLWQEKVVNLQLPQMRSLAMVGLIAGPIALVIIAFVLTHNYPIQPRYYMASLATMGLFAAGTNSNKSLVKILAGLLACNLFLILNVFN